MRALERTDPTTVGRYRLLARLGAGGMAVVYFARSPGRRAAAVKVTHADLAADPVHRERFRREVAATTAAAGRYCPAVLDAGPDAAVPWLATEFLAAVPVRDAVRDHGPLPADAVLPLAAGLAEALGSVHRAGIAHLDVKPSNVLLTVDGPRLIDFGIAAAIGSVGSPAGSWGFMSPEQESSGVVGTASDVYSWGATLVFACTGARHGAVGVGRIADPRLRALVTSCLDPDARGRPTVAELLDRLGAVDAYRLPAAVRADLDRRAGEARNPPVAPAAPEAAPVPVRRRTLLAAGGLAVAAAGAVAVVVLRPDGPAPQRPATPSPPGVSASASVARQTRTVEIFIFGRTRMKTITTEVDGSVETVADPPLPFRRTVEVPAGSGPVAWRFTFTATAGQYTYEVTVDGYRVRSGGGSSTSEDIQGRASSDDA